MDKWGTKREVLPTALIELGLAAQPAWLMGRVVVLTQPTCLIVSDPTSEVAFACARVRLKTIVPGSIVPPPVADKYVVKWLIHQIAPE
jgi:hypothetical protein